MPDDDMFNKEEFLTRLNLTPKYLSAGGCFVENDNEFIRCALRPEDCYSDNYDQIYRSSHWMQQEYKAAYELCSNQSIIQGLRSLGRCSSSGDNYGDYCTSHESACRNSNKFKPLDPTCTIVDDGEKIQEGTVTFASEKTYSIYGYCYDKSPISSSSYPLGFCVWSESECDGLDDDNYEFKVANPLYGGQIQVPPCPAENVITGACVDVRNRSNFFCAVSASVCYDATSLENNNNVFEYVKAYDFYHQGGSNVCFLTNDLTDDRSLPETTKKTITKNPTTTTTTTTTIPAVISSQQYPPTSFSNSEEEKLNSNEDKEKESSDSVCSVCGEGKKVSLLDDFFTFPGQPVVNCEKLENAGKAGLVPVEYCPILSSLIVDICGCIPIMDDNNTNEASILPPSSTAPSSSSSSIIIIPTNDNTISEENITTSASTSSSIKIISNNTIIVLIIVGACIYFVCIVIFFILGPFMIYRDNKMKKKRENNNNNHNSIASPNNDDDDDNENNQII